MKWTGSALTVTILGVMSLTLQVSGQIIIPPLPKELPAKNPLEGDAKAIRIGTTLFRQKCADCHGVDARGVRGPNLTQVWTTGRTDPGLFRTLRLGIPGTEMPPVRGYGGTPDDEIWKILAYLRTLATPAPNDPPRGNAQQGEKSFRENCSRCHALGASGGRFGPDLSRVGASRTRAALELRIRGGVEGFEPGYEPVILTTPAGQQIQGVRKNEDLFSIQIMDTKERIQGYLREDLKTVTDGKRSAMPRFWVDAISESELDDLVAYLATLRGVSTAVPSDGK